MPLSILIAQNEEVGKNKICNRADGPVRLSFSEHTMAYFQSVHTPEHCAQVAQLAREIWREHYLPIIGQNQVDYMLKKFQSAPAILEQIGKSHEYFLVVQDDRNAGYIAVVPSGKGQMLLSKLYVLKSERGHGLGKKALQFVEGLCRERGITLLWLTVNKNNVHSIDWYFRMGFNNTGSTIQDIGGGFVMDDFRLEKEIT